MEQNQKQQAVNYLKQLINDLTNGMGAAVRGPVLREAEAAIDILAAQPEAEAEA